MRRLSWHVVLVGVVAVVWACVAGAVRGQDGAEAAASSEALGQEAAWWPGNVGVADAGGHAWLMLEVERRGGRPAGDAEEGEDAYKGDVHVLMHCVSGGGVADDERQDGEGGSGGRVVFRALGDVPFDRVAGMAAWGDRVWVLMPQSEGAGKNRVRRVMSRRAVFDDRIGLWLSEPSVGMREEMPLAGRFEVVSMSAGPEGPVVLVRDALDADGESEDSGGGDGRERLFVMADSQWHEVDVPWEAGERMGTVGSVWVIGNGRRGEGRTGVELIAQMRGDGVGASAWVGVVEDGRWRWEPRGDGRVMLAGGEGLSRDVFSVDGRLVCAALGGDGVLRVHELGVGEPMTIAAFEVAEGGDVRSWGEQGGSWDAAARQNSGSVVLGWYAGEVGSGEEGEPTGGGLYLKEVTLEGVVLAAGKPKEQSPMGEQYLRGLFVIVVTVVVGVLLFVMRPETIEEVRLPVGYAIAEPSRRLVGFLIDFGLSAGLVNVIAGTSMKAMINPAALVSDRVDEWWPMVVVMAVSLVHTTVMEWLIGRSVGKLVVGTEVVRLRPSAVEEGKTTDLLHGSGGGIERVTLWQAALRNLVKWVFPPTAVLILGDPARRHPGDLIARTLVVVRLVDNEPTAAGPDAGAGE